MNILGFQITRKSNTIERGVSTPLTPESIGLSTLTSSSPRGRSWYKSNPYVYAAVNRIANELASLPITIEKDGEEIESEELNKFFQSPVIGYDSYSQFIHAFVAYYYLEGAALFGFSEEWKDKAVRIKSRPFMGGGFSASFQLDTSGFPRSWTFFRGTIQVQVESDLVSICTPWLYLLQQNGFVPATDSINDILTASQYFSKFVKNASEEATNNAPYVVAKEPFSHQEEERLKSVLARRILNAKAGLNVPTILDNKFEVQANQSFNFPSSADISKLTDSKSAVAAAFGVPLSFFEGVGAYGTGKSADMTGFVLSTIAGLANELRKPFSRIAESILGKGTIAYPNSNKHLAVQELIGEKIAPFSQLVASGIPTSKAAEIIGIHQINKDYVQPTPTMSYDAMRIRRAKKKPFTIDDFIKGMKGDLQTNINYVLAQMEEWKTLEEIEEGKQEFITKQSNVVKSWNKSTMKQGATEFTTSFDEANPLVKSAIAKRETYVEGYAQELFDQNIKPSILKGVEEGQPHKEVIANLKSKLEEEGFTDSRIENIAQTESTWAYSKGREQGAKQSGYRYKIWITSQNNNVRPSHRAAHNQVRLIDEPFDIGGEKMQFPSDSNGSPKEVCNCHCTVHYSYNHPSQDEELIMGD